MKITKSGTQPSIKGIAERYTGQVRVDPLVPEANTPSRVTSTLVTFEPDGRTRWHRHPLGQVLIVTSGSGYVQCESGPVQRINPGDVVWIEPNERHWQGGTATTAMSHVAIQEDLNGSTAEWFEEVSESEYGQE